MLSKISKTFISAILLTSISMAVSASEVVDFSPDDYQFYEQTRSLDHSSEVISRSKLTRSEFSNERFVASAGEDNWNQLESLWKNSERDPLWASEQVLLEDL